MNKIGTMAALMLGAMLVCPGQSAAAMQRQRSVSQSAVASSRSEIAVPRLTGVYRIDLERSDKLYSVVAGASSNLPFGEQQKFFIDLTVRLTPPDLLAIERRGRRVMLASSRAPRITFEADGLTHSEEAGDGQIVKTRATLRPNGLIVSVSGQSEDKFNVAFEPLEGGRFLRVTRRLSNEQLTQPIFIRSVYEKISEVARWDIYDEPRASPDPAIAAASSPSSPSDASEANATTTARDEVGVLRRALEEWIAATNERDIERQLSFYAPRLTAFYLARDVSRAAVRAEKVRVFQNARTIDVQAEAPELIFQQGERTAIMRFRKRYQIEGGGQNRRGAVVQELRWQNTPQGWKIFSERDVRVIR